MQHVVGRPNATYIRKYGGSFHRRRTRCFVLNEGPRYLLAFSPRNLITWTRSPDDDPYPTPARHGGNIYAFDDRWFNVSCMRRDGQTWFCAKIGTPAQFDGETFAFIDFDLDVSWYTDEAPPVLDEEKFLDHSTRMRYPAGVVEQARAAVDHVLGLIGQRAFPFDGV